MILKYFHVILYLSDREKEIWKRSDVLYKILYVKAFIGIYMLYMTCSHTKCLQK